MPLSKIEDFGAHQSQYYQLEISYFKSASDTALLNAIWNKYWIATLSASPLLNNSNYITSQVRRPCLPPARDFLGAPLACSLWGPLARAMAAAMGSSSPTCGRCRLALPRR